MFKQLMPSQTVTLATTFNAIGFLEHRPPFEIPDYILPMGPSRPRPGVGVSDEARKAFATQARDDLNQFIERGPQRPFREASCWWRVSVPMIDIGAATGSTTS